MLLLVGAALAFMAPLRASADRDDVYALELEVDVPVMAVSGLLGASFLLRNELAPAHCAPRCPRDDLSALDRPVAGRFDKDARLVSDVSVAVVLAGSAVTVGLDGGLEHLLIAAEAVLVSSAFNVMTSMAVRRPRPFVYGEDAPLDARMSGSAALSFPSGHTANAFSATLALFHGMRARDPDGALPWIALSVGLALSSTVAAGRVLAGDHFPSDVLAGAVIGASIGWLVPELHRSGSDVALTADSEACGLVVRGLL